MWYDEEGQDKVVYSGRFEKLKRSKTYVVAYWKQNETYDDAEDFELTKYELGADIVCGDLLYIVVMNSYVLYVYTYMHC